MNEFAALSKEQKATKPNFYHACNDALRIDIKQHRLTDDILDNFDELLNWITKHGSNKYFQLPIKCKKLDSLIALKKDLYYFSSRREDAMGQLMDMANIRERLDNEGIRYVDQHFEPEDGSFIFYYGQLLSLIGTIRNIVQLYMFLNGEPLGITRIVRDKKPVLPIEFIVNSHDFAPLSRYPTNIKESFLIHRNDMCVIEHFQSIPNTFEIYDPREHELNEFDKIFDTKRDNTEDSEYYQLYKTDVFGKLYQELASHIICAFLDKYDANTACIKQQCSTHSFLENTNEFIEVEPEELEPEGPDELLGYTEIYSLLSKAILTSRLKKCEYCGQPFVAKRPDAKTCSDLCRNHLSQENRFKKKYNIQ